jgi:hypothetical protein
MLVDADVCTLVLLLIRLLLVRYDCCTVRSAFVVGDCCCAVVRCFVRCCYVCHLFVVTVTTPLYSHVVT